LMHTTAVRLTLGNTFGSSFHTVRDDESMTSGRN
jgi:hypothetical protein